MKRAGRTSSAGFSLIEVAIAFGIISFALVVLLALLPVGLSSSREASAEEAATELLAAASADLRNAPPDASETPFFRLPSNPQGEATEYFSARGAKTATVSDARFRLTIASRTNANPGLQVLHVTVSWPPQVTPPTGRVETLVMRAEPLRL